jgi:hypothetical protein
MFEKILWGMQKQDKLDKISLGKSSANLLLLINGTGLFRLAIEDRGLSLKHETINY